MPSLFPNAIQTPVNWYQFAFLMGNGFGLGARRHQPRRQDAATANLRARARGEREARVRRISRAADLQDDVADQYSFNDLALRRFNETLKDAIDPNGILGARPRRRWPKAFRSMRGGMRSS